MQRPNPSKAQYFRVGLAVTREARLGDRTLVFRNLRIKKHSRLGDQSANSGVPLVGRVAP